VKKAGTFVNQFTQMKITDTVGAIGVDVLGQSVYQAKVVGENRKAVATLKYA
jgi:hypothetical protein